MSASLLTLANALSSECTYYAGDPNLIQADRYTQRILKLLQSDRGDLLAARVAIHAQLRDAFKSDEVQKMLAPYLRSDESYNELIENPRARAKFFSRKQQELQSIVMASEEQKALREAHRELAAWEKENAVLLRHQMFMSYKPSMTLLLESAATIALYRQYAVLEEGEYTSESSSGEVPAQLRKMGGKPLFTTQAPNKPFVVDEHTKMYTQQVLQNKRVEYEEKRALVAERRCALEECPSLQRLQDFINTRNDILRKYGIDRLVSLRARKDKALGEAFEGGEDLSLRGLPPNNEIIKSRRVAQYALPRIINQCHKNYVSILAVNDWDAMLKNTNISNREAAQQLKPLKDLETFRYWFLASITADVPQIGPNKLVGKMNGSPFDEYKKLWQMQKTSYVPSISSSNRPSFARNVAERRGFPHIVILSPVTYSYMQNNDPDTIVKGEIDLMVYDVTNEKVLLMIVNSSDDRRPRGAFLNGQEERYRFAAVIRSAIANDNELHAFECQGTVAEFFFDPESGAEENYYCIMAPLKVSQKSPMNVTVPIKALDPFTSCPPRYLLLGSNWGTSSGNAKNPYAISFLHSELNEDALALEHCIPDALVQRTVMPQLLSRKDGLAQLERERLQRLQERCDSLSARGAGSLRTPRSSLAQQTPRSSIVAIDPTLAPSEDEDNGILPEEEDPLSPIVPEDVLRPVREALLGKQRTWRQPGFLQRRAKDATIKQLPAVRDGQLRTPLQVFQEIMKSKHNEDEAPESTPQSARGRLNSLSFNGKGTPRGNSRSAINVAWF